MAGFPDIKSKQSLVAKYVTEPIWNKLGKEETKTSGFTLSKAIACAVQFDNQHCGIYAGDADSYTVINYLICVFVNLFLFRCSKMCLTL